MKSFFLLMAIICLFFWSGFTMEEPTGREAIPEDFLQGRVDSLQRELLYYKVKEDYFSSALDDQSNRFAVIVGVMLTLVALVSYAGFKNEVRQVKKDFHDKLSAFNAKIEEFDLKNSEYDFNHQLATGNIFSIAAESLEMKEELLTAFEFYVTSARSLSVAGVMQAAKSLAYDDYLTSAKLNVDNAINVLGRLSEDEGNYENLSERAPKVLSELEDINHNLNDALSDSCAELRLLLRKFMR